MRKRPLTADSPLKNFTDASSRTLRRFYNRNSDPELDRFVRAILDARRREGARKRLRGLRQYRMRIDDSWRREIAMEAGMGIGIDAYNEVMGWGP